MLFKNCFSRGTVVLHLHIPGTGSNLLFKEGNKKKVNLKTSQLCQRYCWNTNVLLPSKETAWHNWANQYSWKRKKKRFNYLCLKQIDNHFTWLNNRKFWDTNEQALPCQENTAVKQAIILDLRLAPFFSSFHFLND